MYSSVPNRHACTIINFGGKSPTYMSLLGPTGLLNLKKISHLHVYSILQVYWFWGIFPTYMFIPPYRFINFEHCLFHPTGLSILMNFSHILTYMIGRRQQIEIYIILPLMPCPKSFWFSTNHFGRVQLILVGSKLFWTSPNHKS